MDPYYITPNKDIPLNDRESGELATIALDELKRWQDFAYTWPTFEAKINGRDGVQCGRCSQTIVFRSDVGGNRFQYTIEQIQALIVAHIRQRHAEAINGTE